MHIVSVSSGLGSAYTWKLVCDRHGPGNVTGLFADVNGEHPDNYRFLADVQYALGSRLVKLTNDGSTIWDVMIKERFLANTRIDSCSKFLKREPIRKWVEGNASPGATLYLGIDWTEIHRLDRTRSRWAEFGGIQVASPMAEPPYKTRYDARDWLAAEGIAEPALYAMGFGHANCGGGCVKAGIGQFKRLLSVDRRWYVNWWEAGEERVRASLGRDDISILRDRRGGTFKPLTLRQLRLELEAQPTLFGDDDGGPGCGYCFLGDPE